MRGGMAALCVGLLSAAAAMPAAAGGLGEQVYADSFGNLVVQSPYGTKRIIVGEGRRAKALAAFTAPRHPASRPSPAPAAGGIDRFGYFHDSCYRPAVLIKGRSYMYGLPEGVVPEPAGHCS